MIDLKNKESKGEPGIMTTPAYIPVNHLDFVDEDIKKIFQNDKNDIYTRKTFLSYEPLLAQLIKELRELNGHLRNEREMQKK